MLLGQKTTFCSTLQKKDLKRDALTKGYPTESHERTLAQHLQDSQQTFNPFTLLTTYEFADIQVTADRATATITMVVDGQTRYGRQHLANIRGRWYVAQSSEVPEYSATDTAKIQQLTHVTADLSRAFIAMARDIRADRLSPAQVRDHFNTSMHDYHQRRQQIKAS